MTAPDPDMALVARLARGEPAAVRELTRVALPRIHALSTRLLHDHAEADDVAQETLLRAWRQASRWRPGGARFDTWMHTVALNLCRDRLRRRARIADEAPPDVADPTPGADRAIEADERGRLVAAAIAALPERQREAILLVHYQDLAGAEAAAALDVSVEALESLLARGRRTLRARLTETVRDDDD